MSNYIEIDEVYTSLENSIVSSGFTKDSFITYLEDNDWFNIEIKIETDGFNSKLFVPVNEFKTIKERIISYFVNCSNEYNRNKYLFNLLEEKLPITSMLLNEYLQYEVLDIKCSNQILDVFLKYLPEEVTSISTEGIYVFLQTIADEISIQTQGIILIFLNQLFDRRKTKFRYLNGSNIIRISASKTKIGYDFEKISKLFYVLFSEESIKKNKFYERIASNRKTAVGLLYMSLHLICALRDTDIVRLPHPKLMDTPSNILDNIANNTFEDNHALIAVEKILREIQLFQPKPNKVKNNSRVPSIKLFIPENCKVHFGKLFVAAEAHYLLDENSNKNYIYSLTKFEDIQKYLGDDVADIFWDVNYSSRAFNKSYMQLIQDFVDATSGGFTSISDNMVGYMFASFARSHVNTYNDFAATTQTYLRDHATAGKSLDTIAYELSERGVCSFAVSELLEILHGKEFRKLGLSEQTKVINEFGLSPYQVEQLVSFHEVITERAKNVVNSLLPAEETERKYVSELIMRRITLNRAPSKTEDVYCLLSAMGRTCPFENKKSCIGCGYEVLTKEVIYRLSKEHNRLTELYKIASDSHLKNKYKYMLNDVVNPAIYEILSSMVTTHGENSILELDELIKEVIKIE